MIYQDHAIIAQFNCNAKVMNFETKMRNDCRLNCSAKKEHLARGLRSSRS